MVHTKLIALLVACSALSGCCVSGTGCSAPAPGTPLAWDGLGQPPTADGEPAGPPSKPVRRAAPSRDREIVLGPLNGAPPPQSDAKARYDDWTRAPNEDAEADARLARQTKICKGC